MQPNLKKSVSTLAMAASLLAGATWSTASHACAAEPYLGSVCTVAFNYCPTGYLPADGRQMPINTYAALSALLGTTFGGDGKTYFNLPDLRSRIAVGAGQGTKLTNVKLGDKRGVESLALSTAQTPLAAHTHAAVFTATGGGSASASGKVSLPLSGSVNNVPVTGSVVANALTTQTTGATNLASNTNNTVGKNANSTQFYPYSASTAVASPTTINLSATGGTLTGTAAADVSLPVTGSTGITGGTVAVAANTPVPASQAVPVLNPGLGLTMCIAIEGLWPARP